MFRQLDQYDVEIMIIIYNAAFIKYYSLYCYYDSMVERMTATRYSDVSSVSKGKPFSVFIVHGSVCEPKINQYLLLIHDISFFNFQLN